MCRCPDLGSVLLFVYTVKAGGAPAFSKNRQVFASLFEGVDEGVRWCLTNAPDVGKDVYIIDNPVTKDGWVLPENEAGTQVACGLLIVGPSEPPFFPPNQLWIITPVD
ncbi:uncharacterized protein LACBIDRAFT_332177 [Laccaria bicolor S238N-H82]|uniref:Predicted protein n=1 Tax=Laccaria bicolor (strain S238N-H82 / ATCC MYA-4686) TaxID=486041 RepID=B0DRU6_LACBS|nr:uncharacterized protein LACBIDRAFT_332177 [Laccaria bicolor S238N-H82]EDR02671.1 predicted protein [Laccaria bicolor S238N-H82]|eukprot:XP_001886715.1 predicted protein [Laccaria bicolor S238N-H82]